MKLRRGNGLCIFRRGALLRAFFMPKTKNRAGDKLRLLRLKIRFVKKRRIKKV